MSVWMQWVEKWIGQPVEQWAGREKRKVLEDWTVKWTEEQRETERAVRPRTDLVGSKVIPEDILPNAVMLTRSKMVEAQTLTVTA